SGGATMDEIDRLLDVIRGRNAKTVGLQFPVGLRTTAVDLAREIETKAGVMCLVSADPSFGACDVAEMPVDLIVHLGHAPMPHLRYNRVFFYDLPGAPLASMAFVDAAEPMLPKRVALLTTTQFRHWLPDIQQHLEKKGHVVEIGEPDRRVAYAGQLLGCDYHTATNVEKALAEKHGKQANLFLMDLVAPELLQGYRVDAWVNTACPRIAIEDILQYKQPMLTPQEFEIVLGERTWDDYVFDEIRA